MLDYFSPAYIAVAGFFSLLGAGAAMYGKSTQNFLYMIVGILLCGVSYFITDPLALGIVSSLLTGVLFIQPASRYYYERKHRNIEVID